MKRPKNLEGWGREKARARYAEGGEIESMTNPKSKLDELIAAIAEDQMANIREQNDGDE